MLGLLPRETGSPPRIRARAVIMHVAFTSFETDKGVMDALVGPRKNTLARGRGVTTTGDPALVTSLMDVLYADDAVVVSQSLGQPQKIIVVIVTLCTAFDLTIHEGQDWNSLLANEGDDR